MNPPPDPSRRLRVLQCITRLGLGGAERMAFGLMDALRPGVDCAVFTVHGAGGDAVGDGLQRELAACGTPWFAGTAVPMKAGGMLPGAFALARAVRSFRPDVVHFHSETPESCGATLAQFSPAFARMPMVRTIHNSVFWRYWPRVGRWCDRRLAHAHIACVSEAAREEFLRYRADSGAGRPPAEPGVIYNGVNLPPLTPRPGPLQPGRRRVLFAGRFEMQKGADVLCQALAQVRLPADTRGELTFMGHGAQAARINALAANPPPGWGVAVLPPAAGLTEVFAQHDLVVMPSRFEGLGLVAIEATLCGLPVVATDAPGLRETLPADYPWRARPGDAASLAQCLGTGLAETGRWAESVRGAQDFSRARFSPAAMGESYRQLYALAHSGR